MNMHMDSEKAGNMTFICSLRDNIFPRQSKYPL